MPVPKRKRSRRRRDMRFANKGIEVKAITKCKNCQEPTMPHVACKSCGHYKGIKVMTTKMDRATKRGNDKRRIAQQARAQRMQAAAAAQNDEPQE